MSPYYAVLLSLLLSVEAFQPASQCLRAGHVRSASVSMLALRPINAGDELIAHDTFDQEHAVGLIQQDFSDAQQPKKWCGQCSECTCGRNTAKGSRTGVPKMSARGARVGNGAGHRERLPQRSPPGSARRYASSRTSSSASAVRAAVRRARRYSRLSARARDAPACAVMTAQRSPTGRRCEPCGWTRSSAVGRYYFSRVCICVCGRV